MQEELDWISPETSRGPWPPVSAFRSTQVDSVVQFYSFLYDEPRGRYRILFSDNITDRMLGSLALFEHMLKRLKLERGEVSADGAGQRRPDLLHRHVRPGPGAARQQSPDHPPDRAPRRRDLRSGARRRAARRWPADFFRVEDNIRRAGALLGSRYEPGSAPARRDRASAARACSTK